ncbi:hypothetical protein FVEG_08075 [Fusarium verticillioides 7600]|uniref:Uncharacterized protein n=1 Tax=Gibberella moniliformis (strain M3125 / FGSC 7600) TaxID=334819 RepID=W7M9E3_GIBM7|nr:hypothetical protein FVEG_08075 [Fusarium verticillioides 7600]EWG48223.1 hypothetical protein FVEG_08075 [Fusarium verticillioides 7600]
MFLGFPLSFQTQSLGVASISVLPPLVSSCATLAGRNTWHPTGY